MYDRFSCNGLYITSVTYRETNRNCDDTLQLTDGRFSSVACCAVGKFLCSCVQSCSCGETVAVFVTPLNIVSFLTLTATKFSAYHQIRLLGSASGRYPFLCPFQQEMNATRDFLVPLHTYWQNVTTDFMTNCFKLWRCLKSISIAGDG